ncbi:MAG: hypothetical protein AB7R67_20320 [Vicinamibacterales bacterium]
MRAPIVLLVLALWSTGCASMRPAPVTNPTLGQVGRVAVRAAQIVNALDVAQRQIEPLVDAQVLTAAEGLTVAKAFGTAFEQAKALVALLTLADAATSIAEQVQSLSRAKDAIKALQRTVTGATTGIGGLAGRIVVGSLAGTVTDAIVDAGVAPVGGGQ